MKKFTTLLLPLMMMPCLTFLVCSNNAATKSSKVKKSIDLHEQIAHKTTRAWEPFLNQFIGFGDVVLMFYANYCIPCKNMKPLIDDLAEQLAQYTFVKAECELFEKLAQKFDINNIPTLIFLRDGKEIGRYTGGPLTKNELKKLIIRSYSK